VLVTQVQGGTPVASTDGDVAEASAQTPDTAVMVTLAVLPRDAEQIVFGQEHGTLWLSLEPEGTDTSGTQVLTQGNVYGTAAPR
jgi:pilus assembly protein CpaB